MPAGRRRHACDKCVRDHKSCVPILDRSWVAIGCQKCLRMPSVRSCSISSSQEAFLLAKSRCLSPTVDLIHQRDNITDSAQESPQVLDTDMYVTPPTVDLIHQRGGTDMSENDEPDKNQTIINSDDSDFSPSDASDTPHTSLRQYADTQCYGSALFFVIDPLHPHIILTERHFNRVMYQDLQNANQYVFTENRSFPNSVLKHNNHGNLVMAAIEGRLHLA
eukprot:scaffold35173_cov36-Cyclotella_meneghiniana.AAC.1